MTWWQTIISAVVIFVLGQIIIKLFIQPIQELQKTLAGIATALTRYYSVQLGGWYDEDGSERTPTKADRAEVDRVSGHLICLAAELRANIAIIPFYKYVRVFFGLPSKDYAKDASVALLQWAQFIYGEAVSPDITGTIDKRLKLGVMWYFDHTMPKRRKQVVKEKSLAAINSGPLFKRAFRGSED